jgi:uncharacterized protein (TIGR02099 family)
MPGIVRKVWRWTAGIVGVLLIVLAMAVGMFRLFLPQLPEYRAQIEQWATQALARPLRIGSIDARLSLEGPRIVFRDTVVLAPDGLTPVIDADSISVVISLVDLLLDQRLAVASVRIEGVVLEVERLEDGRISILNREFPALTYPEASQASAASPPEVPDGRYEIRDATIRLTTAARRGEVLVFNQASLDVDKHDGELSLGVTIKPPPELGQSIRITGNILGLDGPPEEKHWQLLLQAESIDLAGWQPFIPEKLSIPVAGKGNITVWGSIGQDGLDNAIIDVSLDGLELPDTGDLKQAEFQKLAGKLELVKKPGELQLHMRDLAVERDGRSWQAAQISLEARPDNGESQLVYVTADQVQLDDLLPFLRWVPEAEVRSRLLELEPRGLVSDLNAQFAIPPEGSASYSVRASLARVGLNAAGAFPGVDNLGGTFKASADGGELQLTSPGLALNIPKVFEKSLRFDEAAGRVSWRFTPTALTVSASDMVLANADIYTLSRLNLELPADGSAPEIDLETQIKDGNVAAKTPYLPIVKLSPAVRAWLDKSLVGGRIPRGRLLLRGPLDRFPFAEGGGRFQVDFVLEDLALDYQPEWPALTGVNANVRFEGAGLEVDLLGGDLAGNTIVQGKAEIPRLATGRLSIKAQTRGSVNAGLAFLAAIPPGERYRDSISGLETSGQAQVDMDLYLPLKQIADNRVTLDMQISDGAVRPVGLDRGLEQIDGLLRLEDGGLFGEGITATYLGKPTRVEVSPDPSAEGVRATLMLLRGWSDAGELVGQFFPLIQPWVSGRTDWFAVARFPSVDSDQPVTVSARSVLGGLGISLPRPMYKKAEDPRMLEVLYTFNDKDRRTLELALGDDIRANLVLRKQDESWQLGFGDIALGGKVPDRDGEPGLGISGRTAVLQLDEWLGLQGSAAPGASGPGLAETLKRADLEVDDFTAMGMHQGATSLRLRNTGTEWAADIVSENVVGKVTVPQDAEGELPTRVDMEKLWLADVGDSADQPNERPERQGIGPDPRALRGYEIRAADFGIADMRLGSLEASVSRAPMGLSLDRFVTRHPAFVIEGVGSWLLTADGQMTGVKLKAKGTDILEMFKSLGLGTMISGRQLSSDVDVYWKGGPDSNPMQTMSGQVRLQLDDGTVAKIEPGAGRALGLLSVTTLPRRLTLDFRDVFDEGLAFDRISGDFSLVDGNAYTSNLVMEGPSVGIAISGRTGLADHTYDQVAVVHANIGSSLPLAGALAGGPTLGAALLIFSEVFKEPLQGMSRARYKVTGTWDEPRVERLELTSAPAPEAPKKSVPAGGDSDRKQSVPDTSGDKPGALTEDNTRIESATEVG